MRFLVSPDGQTAVWRHYLDGNPLAWIDCTGMTDDDFDSLITSLQKPA